MQITDSIHALELPFQIPVAPDRQVSRAVYVYLLPGGEPALIDSGTAGAEAAIFAWLEELGRRPEELLLLLLSHSHPDHIGAARTIQAVSGCRIAAHAGERSWIEDTELQLAGRPVPGFQSLVAGPVRVDRWLEEGERLQLGATAATVLHTPGHSRGSISLWFEAERALFTGDALPLPGDLPIYEDIATSRQSIGKMQQLDGVDILLTSLSAPVEGRQQVAQRIAAGAAYLDTIDQAVLAAAASGIGDSMELCRAVVAELGLPPFAANPLVARAFASSL